MDQAEITPQEAKTLYEILLWHEARTLDPCCTDYRKLNLMLDKLRSMLRQIMDGEGICIPAGR
ncbi:hypothetical protein KKA14_06885 [bacterium]|nr:hypothetical protein [bacterium]